MHCAPVEVESMPLPRRRRRDMTDDKAKRDWTIDRNPDGHLHGFVFIDHADLKIDDILSAVATKYRRKKFPRVRWAGSVIGDYLALAHVEVDRPDDLAGLQTFMEDALWEEGVHCKKATELAVVNKKGTKKDTPDILGLVGIKTEHGQTMAVAEALAKLDADRGFDWFKGASILNGHIDILLQLNTDTFTQQQDLLFLDKELAGVLGTVPGIAWTSTAIADGSRGPWAKPSPKGWETPRKLRPRGTSSAA